MKIEVAAIVLMYSISNMAYGQQRQTVFSVESRVGFSSNTYLNPYFSEWDRSAGSGYGAVSVLGQTAWFDKKNVLELTGGAVFEPFWDGRETWKGGLGLFSYQRRLSNKISVGLEAGASYFTSSFDRTLIWAQPALTWFSSAFTLFRFKAGSNLRRYNNFMIDSVSTDSQNRVDLYSLEFETWPSFRWQLTAGLYGSLNNFPAIHEGFSSVVTSAYVLKGGGKIRLKFGLEQYQNEITTTTPSGGGFPPVGGPPGSMTETAQQTDRILKFGIGGDFPVTNDASLFLNVEGLQFHSTATGESIDDFQVSVGVRLTIQPRDRNQGGTAKPEWKKKGDLHQVEIRYAGEGQLYILGDFNDWERPGIPLVQPTKNRYVAQLHLDTGAYEYKVLRIKAGEEDWIKFSDDTYTVDDSFGGENAMLLIES